MVAKAKDDLEQELVDKEAEKERYLSEKTPPIHTREMSFAELQVCPQLTKLYWYYYRIENDHNKTCSSIRKRIAFT